jgi:hypothetical protein
LNLALLVLRLAHFAVTRINGGCAAFDLEQPVCLQPIKPKAATLHTSVHLNLVLYHPL